MIGITKLYCGAVTPSDALRYRRESASLPAHLLQFAQDKKPVVVWNCSRRCNLSCIHCYSDSRNKTYPGELTTAEAKVMIDDLAAYKAPVLLFSGGEPLMREDLFELATYASGKGLRVVISTNGTLITPEAAKDIKKAGISYVGVSLDGIGNNNDRFRGKKGAFDEALRGIENCREVDQRVGLRLTLTKHNTRDLTEIFRLIEEVRIERACFYHLVYTGRGTNLKEDDLTHQETREAVDLICQKSMDFYRRGVEKEILTVDNHADGVYVYLKVKQEQPERAEEVLQLLRWNGGNASGIGIADVDNQGNVHADQFWQDYTFGNVRERPFSQIWEDTSDPLMAGLKDRKALLKGKCGRCAYLDICNGNFRSRAKAIYDDVWAEDPACYLTEEELGMG
ncbi:MAG: radical SAM protein [Dehalococcoidia bacterium]|nr:radical SAM protein [Dehalococcoidia bacterium]